MKEQRELVNALLYGERGDEDLSNALRLAELVEALDEWMSHGGFSPWQDIAAWHEPMSER